MNPAVIGLISLGAVVFGIGMLSVLSGARQRRRHLLSADKELMQEAEKHLAALSQKERDKRTGADGTNPAMAMAGPTGANESNDESRNNRF